MRYHRLISILLLLSALSNSFVVKGQRQVSTLNGVVVDAESRSTLGSAVVEIKSGNATFRSVTDSTGQFQFKISPGRHSIYVSHIGYNNIVMRDILLTSGKDVFVVIQLSESLLKIDDAVVISEKQAIRNTNAVVSVKRLRSQDASKYASGYFDPLRMVTSLPGVSAGNDDDNNQISVRGNSPKGMLWRIEGLEIPNPNHLASGEGGSGGAYSAITTNVLSGFDFFSGAFPAEYGNAISGVMDLSLRSGNPRKNEYTAGVGVVGAEGSAEGPILLHGTGSWFVNLRYANFNFLKKYGIIDNESIGIIPNSYDWGSKISYFTGKKGVFELFTVGGGSKVGDYASNSVDAIKNGADNDEFIDKHFFAVAGFKHSVTLPSEKTFLRTTVGLTWQSSSTDNYVIDTFLIKRRSYGEKFIYPALRVSFMINHKLSPSSTIRAGVNANIVEGDMKSERALSSGEYDTLINSRERGWYNSYYLHWKYKSKRGLESTTGVHFFHSAITGEFIIEPRLGLRVPLNEYSDLNLAFGQHSKLEPLSIYHYMVKLPGNVREKANRDLKSTRALHFVLGINGSLLSNLKANVEFYWQHLYSVPQAQNNNSRYSVLNISYGLPDFPLNNRGTGRNVGIEIMLERQFFRNSYFLASTSIFDSKYRAPDGKRYSTYFNNGFVFTFTGGHEFAVGSNRNNILGVNIKTILRGGYRYTPVDTKTSLSKKRIVYDIQKTYGNTLPEYIRVDIGVSYRVNRRNSTWTFLAEVQNATNRNNVIRRRFNYTGGRIVSSDSYSVGIIPILTARVEF